MSAKTIPIYQVDAFASSIFSGNPAAVCLLEKWIKPETMQKIAEENNLAETAFVVGTNKGYEIRWFTPMVEVDLCGHATLASAFVLDITNKLSQNKVAFRSRKSGVLTVNKNNDLYFLDFLADKVEPSPDVAGIERCLGFSPQEIYKGRTDYIAVVSSAPEVKNLEPDLRAVSLLNGRGLIVTAKGSDVDFVSRFFAPQLGINEDAVTGSAHTSLIPLWYKKTGKRKMTATQLSKRGGNLKCVYVGDRCHIGGTEKLYMKGNIYIGREYL